jgi:hypothetical protein
MQRNGAAQAPPRAQALELPIGMKGQELLEKAEHTEAAEEPPGSFEVEQKEEQ